VWDRLILQVHAQVAITWLGSTNFSNISLKIVEKPPQQQCEGSNTTMIAGI
jgi:hypothetical protein